MPAAASRSMRAKAPNSSSDSRAPMASGSSPASTCSSPDASSPTPSPTIRSILSYPYDNYRGFPIISGRSRDPFRWRSNWSAGGVEDHEPPGQRKSVRPCRDSGRFRPSRWLPFALRTSPRPTKPRPNNGLNAMEGCGSGGDRTSTEGLAGAEDGFGARVRQASAHRLPVRGVLGCMRGGGGHRRDRRVRW